MRLVLVSFTEGKSSNKDGDHWSCQGQGCQSRSRTGPSETRTRDDLGGALITKSKSSVLNQIPKFYRMNKYEKGIPPEPRFQGQARVQVGSKVPSSGRNSDAGILAQAFINGYMSDILLVHSYKNHRPIKRVNSNKKTLFLIAGSVEDYNGTMLKRRSSRYSAVSERNMSAYPWSVATVGLFKI
jgi:hypothetical protein